MRAHTRPLLGVAALVVIVLLVSFSIGVFRKALPWQDAATVTITTASPGLELNPQSDVKLQGRRVGEVRKITTAGTRATIELALDKDALELIPVNVDAAIVPKTLFGEKFVDLRPPARPATARLADGGVIKQSTTSVEIGALFGRLVPVLEALEPEKLSTVIGSLAEALDGRGEQLGRTLNQLTAFLHGVDPRLDTFTHDLRQLATTADVYAESTPDLMRVLSASSGISSGLLVPQEKQFAAALASAIGTTKQAETVLAENSRELIRLSGRSRDVLALLDEYSSALPCFLQALHTGDILVNQTAGALGPFANLTIDMVTHQAPYTYPDDLPSNPKSDGNNANLPVSVPSWEPHCAEFASSVLKLKNALPYSQELPSPVGGRPGAASARADDPAVVEARRAMAQALAARLLGEKVDAPDYAGVLIAPLLSDGEVPVP
ncbi:phospholipid/cholesterol/gamma-HCH transport system substrate-binding protein [Marmoricola sp. OAE513]|uniref:MCE family protein n=1 Tax=Marmoricola sp. OAE513 TaxID=2817894 RepID=UPI001AEAF231